MQVKFQPFLACTSVMFPGCSHDPSRCRSTLSTSEEPPRLTTLKSTKLNKLASMSRL